MKLRQLPPEIALLAMQRISEQGKKPDQDSNIASQFTFAETPEGHQYWKEVQYGNFVKPVYPKPKGSKVIIKLKNDLWTSSKKFSNSSL